MSKQIKQKNGINIELTKKQTLDLIALMLIFLAIFVVVEFTKLNQAALGGVLKLIQRKWPR